MSIKCVISLQRIPDDHDEAMPESARSLIKRLGAECIRLLEEHPGSEWMTQTGVIRGNKRLKR